MKRIMGTACYLAAAIVILGQVPLTGTDGAGGLDRLLPAANEIPGWKADGAPLRYTPDNLWEHIDGSAESFLAYSFQELLVQNYTSKTQEEVKVEIYEMDDPLTAFGIYSQFRSPGLDVYDIGNEAFGDEYSINFWKDRYYVRVAVFEKDPDLLAAARGFAAAVASKIVKGGALPPESCALPEEGICKMETTFLPQSVLGREKFPPAFVASYTSGEEQGKLYLSTLADSASARSVFDWYTSEVRAATGPKEGPYGAYMRGTGTDQFQGDVVVFQFGKWLGVVTGFKAGAHKSEELVGKTIERLAKLKGAAEEMPKDVPSKK